jgi:hypothetical protein
LNDTRPTAQPTKNDIPTEGHILHAEAYPLDEEMMTFHLLYSETSGGQLRRPTVSVGKDAAETLAKQILRILAEPAALVGSKNIAADIEEGDHEE